MLLFANKAKSTLASSITTTATTVVLASGGGAAFPVIVGGSGNTFLITVTSATSTTVSEIMLVTARTGDTLTVTRHQEGTSATAFLAGDNVEQLVTAGTMQALIQSPALIANGGTGLTTSPTNGQLLIGNGSTSAFALSTLTAGTGITITNGAGSISIAATGAAVPSGCMMVWTGSIASIPAGWVLCDGTNGTPDMRDAFIVGAGYSYYVGQTGGSTTQTVTVGNTTLTAAQIASHTHYATVTDPQHVHPIIDPQHQHAVVENTIYVLGGPNPQGVFGTDHTAETNLASTGVTVAPAATGITVANATAGGDQSHTHSASTTTNLPPFRALAWIMKL